MGSVERKYIDHETKDRYYVIAKDSGTDDLLLYLSMHAANGTKTAFVPEWGWYIPERTVSNLYAFDTRDEAYKALVQRRYNVTEKREWSYADERAFVVEIVRETHREADTEEEQ